jgi:hypothetical protein
MAAGPAPGDGVPEHWLTVHNAVDAACAAEQADSAPTGHIARRLRASGSPPARTLLRVLRRRGYVHTIQDADDGAPLRWGLTAAGRAATAAPSRQGHRTAHLTARARRR